MKSKKISRRDFLKVAGLAGAAVPAGGLAGSEPQAPKNPPADGLDPAGRPYRPWWVRRVAQPTIAVRWEQMQRFDPSNSVYPNGTNLADFVGQERAAYLDQHAHEKEKAQILANTPGAGLKEVALLAAQRTDIFSNRSFLGPQVALTPTERGVPRWEGSPDEAARILRVAMRHFGAAQVGFVELNEQTRKLIFSHDRDRKELAFTSDEQADETPDRRIIPRTARWVIVYTVQMSSETLKTAPSLVSAQTTMLAYGRARFIQNHTQEFLRGLGYQCLGQSDSNGLGLGVGFAVLAGLGELSRSNRLITPEYGPMVRVFMLITDLPVTLDQPIDAGILRFCRHCKKCAETCPAGAISNADEPTWQVQGRWNNPGHQAYFEDAVKCQVFWRENPGTSCSICFAVCPFSKKSSAWMHELVKASVSEAPLLDSFIRSMDDAFSYGAQKDPEEWWRLNLPEYGINDETSI